MGKSTDFSGLAWPLVHTASLLNCDVETALHKPTNEMHSVALSRFLACAQK